MVKRKFSIVLLFMTLVSMTAYGQIVLAGADGEGPKLSLTGELIGMATLGLADEDQWVVDQDNIEKGAHKAIGVYNEKNGKNGYYTALNFGILFSPVSTVDLYSKFLIRYRPGTAYVPLQLPDASQEDFVVRLDAVYGRVNAVKGLGFDIPVDVWLKAGKYDTTPENYHKVTSYGAESVMTSLRTRTAYSMQIDAAYTSLPFAESVSMSFTTSQRLGDAIDKLYDEDADGILHGQTLQGDQLQNERALSFFSALRMKDIALPFGDLSWELLWVLNGENIYSKHSFGADVGAKIKVMDGLDIPVGLAASLFGLGMGGNIDPFAGAGGNVGRQNNLSLYADTADDVGLRNDADVTSFREALRIGAAAGVRFGMIEDLAVDLNLGFSYSSIAHYYRETIGINSMSVDMKATYQNRFFIGGGIFLGTLKEVTWRTKDEVLEANTASNVLDIYAHTFKMTENMGFEVYGGLKFENSKFVVGYNKNKGLSMSHGIESMHETQVMYRQKDSGKLDGLFETGGVFLKLVVSW